MTRCSILQCSACKNQHFPNISFHRLPRSAEKRQKWLDLIGEENIKPNTKNIFICSQHFEENCFNRTLDIIRLRDDALPSQSLLMLLK